MSDIRKLVESALSQHIAATTSATVYSGTDNETKSAPCVIVHAGSSQEEIPQSGIHRVTVRITVKSVAAADTGAHDTLCAAVLDAVKIDDASLRAALAAYESSLVFFGNGGEDNLETGQDGDVWTLTYSIQLVCC